MFIDNSSSKSDSSDEKSEISDESNYSIAIKFPDKVKMPKSEDQTSTVFKLDFAKVNAKYESSVNNMKGKFDVENINIPQNKKLKQEKKKNEKKNESEDNLDLIIEKLKNEMKNSNKTVKDLTSKFEKHKNTNNEMKQKVIKLKENLKMVNSKITTLETQLKEFGGDNRANTSLVSLI